jgi:hypothetical protein
MTALTYAKNYQPIVYEWFLEGVDGVPSLIPELFDVQTTTDINTYSLGIGGIPVEMWDQYRLNSKTGYVEPDRGYPKTFTLVEYPIRLPIKKLYLQTDKTGLIREAVNEVAVSAAQKKETDAASVLNNAFTNSAPYLGPDGVALCYASHPVGPDNTGTVRDNTGTEALSYTAMKNARLNMRALTDGQANPYQINGKLVVAPIQLEDLIIEIFTALGKPGGANNDGSAVNRQQGWDYRTWDWLTDDESWWLIDQARAKRFLKWYNFGGYESMVVEETTTDIVYEFKMTYIYGWRHWSFVYGNAV